MIVHKYNIYIYIFINNDRYIILSSYTYLSIFTFILSRCAKHVCATCVCNLANQKKSKKSEVTIYR